jgi:hypothetical protein
MSDFSVFGKAKPYGTIEYENSDKATFEKAHKTLDQSKPDYKILDRIGNFDGYIVTFDRFISGIAYINVNGKKFPIKSGSGTHAEIYRAVKTKIEGGQFASRVAKAFCSTPNLEENATIIVQFR